MTEVKRSYDASGRRAQARARRLAVVLAAREKFERDGYRPTTIAAIAAQAGVSAESVYKGFGTKAALAKAVFDLALAGDDEPVPVAERPSVQAIRDETDVRRKIAMFAAGLAQRQARSAPCRSFPRRPARGRLAGPDLAEDARRGADRHDGARPSPARDRPAPGR